MSVSKQDEDAPTKKKIKNCLAFQITELKRIAKKVTRWNSGVFKKGKEGKG